MNKKCAFIFPGQGAQYVGMGKDFYDHFPVAREVFEEADEHLKQPLSRLIFEGPSSELMLTKNSQVAIYVTSLAMLKVVQQQYPDLHPQVCAGLSLGEYTALTASMKISFKECLELVRLRALYMHEACERVAGGMQVVLALGEEEIEKVLNQKGLSDRVWIANLNCPGQVVIAGTQEGLTIAAVELKQAGAKRVLPLEVSGAFHSGLMRSAQELLAPKIRQVVLENSSIDLVMNVPGGYVRDLEGIRQYLIDQVVSPVRWEKEMRTMASSNVACYLEIGPGKTLAGMYKRMGIEASMWNVEKITDLEGILCNC